MGRVAAVVASIPVGSVRKPGDRDTMNVFAAWCPAVVGGIAVDCDASARLVSAEQRGFLTWRDRHGDFLHGATCRRPGCEPIITYALHARHATSYARGG